MEEERRTAAEAKNGGWNEVAAVYYRPQITNNLPLVASLLTAADSAECVRDNVNTDPRSEGERRYLVTSRRVPRRSWSLRIPLGVLLFFVYLYALYSKVQAV